MVLLVNPLLCNMQGLTKRQAHDCKLEENIYTRTTAHGNKKLLLKEKETNIKSPTF